MFPAPRHAPFCLQPLTQAGGCGLQRLQPGVVVQGVVCLCGQGPFRSLGVQAAGSHLRRDTVPRHDARHAGFKGRSDHAQAVALSLCRRAHDDRTVQYKKGRTSGLRRPLCRPDARHNGRVGQTVQRGLALRGGKGAVSQQTAIQRAVRAKDLPTEPRRKLRQQRRAWQQNFPAELVGVGQRHTVGGKYRRDRGFAAAAAPRDAQGDHRSITRKAAARIRRLYTAMDRPSFCGQRA